MSDEAVIEWMGMRIRDLSECEPMWSRSAYTHRRTVHVAFMNGAVKMEGEEAPTTGYVEPSRVRDLAEATINAVRAYRETIPGLVNLVWRTEPEINRSADGVRIYCRLCFEPLLEVAQ